MADDPADLARGLISSEPFMVIPSLVAKGGQAVQDAWDTVKSHLSDLAAKTSNAVSPTVQAQAANPAPAASAPAAGKKYRVKLSDGSEFNVTTDGAPPSESDVMEFLKQNPQNAKPAPTATTGSGLGTMADALQTAKEVGKGFVKGAGRTVQFLADDVPHAFGGAGLSDYVDLATGRPPGQSYQQVKEGLQSRGTAQSVGAGIEGAAELAAPLSAAGEAIPTTAKAGKLFQNVMGVARNVPVDVEPAGQAALRIQQLAERGGRMPKPVNDFLRYVTNPDKPPLTYEAGRDFLTNLGKLSVNERNSLTPVVQREVAIMTGNLAKAVADAASKVGAGETYAQAMTQYARAKGVTGMIDDFLKGARKSLPWMLGGGAAAAGAYGGKKVMDMVNGE